LKRTAIHYAQAAQLTSRTGATAHGPEDAVTESQASFELHPGPVRTEDTGLADRNGLLRFLLLGKHARLWPDVLRRRLLAVADLTASLLACLALAALTSPGTGAWAVLSTPVWLLLAKLFGLYDRDHRSLHHLTIDELPALSLWALASTGALVLLIKPAPPAEIGLATAFAVWGIIAASAGVSRSLVRWLWRRVTPAERTLIVGDGPLAQATRRKLELFPDTHVAVIDQRGLASARTLRGGPDWPPGVNRVIVASSSMDGELLAELVSHCRQERIKLSVVPSVQGMLGTAVQLSHLADLPVIEYNTWDVSRSTLLLKRVLDLAISAPLLLLTAPVIALVALAIRLDGAGPAFFVQRRAGLDGRPFRMIKFRTMVPDAEDRLSEVVTVEDLPAPMFKLVRDPRVTRIGRLLRRTSLDELPQLLNVVKGDMSLVGPRPEQIELVGRYRPEHEFRLAVKPGLTGPMQVYGRGELRFEERLAVERDYIENLSLGRDLRILGLTLTAVVAGRGAY
jgi:exopolysaccharide biosynthesis polyprenyl glycosylphosphotransferase